MVSLDVKEISLMADLSYTHMADIMHFLDHVLIILKQFLQSLKLFPEIYFKTIHINFLQTKMSVQRAFFLHYHCFVSVGNTLCANMLTAINNLQKSSVTMTLGTHGCPLSNY